MEAIVINRNLTPVEEKEVLDFLKEKNQPILYSKVDLSHDLRKCVNREIELSPEEKKEINYNILKRIIQFGELKVNDSVITDILTFEKVSIWHYHKFRIYFSIRNLFYEIELIKKLRKEYEKVYYYGVNNLWKDFPFEPSGIHINIKKSP